MVNLKRAGRIKLRLEIGKCQRRALVTRPRRGMAALGLRCIQLFCSRSISWVEMHTRYTCVLNLGPGNLLSISRCTRLNCPWTLTWLVIIAQRPHDLPTSLGTPLRLAASGNFGVVRLQLHSEFSGMMRTCVSKHIVSC